MPRIPWRRACRPVVMLIALTVGLLTLTPVGPAAGDAPWCSSACNGAFPANSVTLLNGAVVKCVNSAVAVGGPYHPIGGGTVGSISDPNMTLRHMYSNSCQTTWVRMTNSAAIGRTSCYAFERRYVSPVYETLKYSCPSVGHTLDTAMVNDHDDAGRAVAYGYLSETTVAQNLSRQTDPY